MSLHRSAISIGPPPVDLVTRGQVRWLRPAAPFRLEPEATGIHSQLSGAFAGFSEKTPPYFRRNFFTYAAPTSALVIGSTAKLPPCSTKKCFIPDIAASGQIFV